MTIEEIRKGAPDATHYFEWWDGYHVFKKNENGWEWWVNNSWTNADLLKIYWWFGWKCKTKYMGGSSHKLKPI